MEESMGKRLWLLALVVVASVVMAAGATAKTTGSNSSSSSSAKTTLVFGAEQDVNGFNTNLNCCSQFWAVVIGNAPVIRGAFLIRPNGTYAPDLLSGYTVHFGSKPYTITYFIKKAAKWSDGVPVTGADFVYGWQQIIDPKNDVTGRDGYDQIVRSKVSNKGKTVKFTFKTPYADWHDLFITPTVMPAHVLKGEDYNKIWPNCVCNPKTGKPISDGPYLLQSYRKGIDATLVKNPKWWGPKAKLSKIVFRFIQDTNSEIQAMRGGEVDAIAPSPQSNLTQLQNQRGLVYNSIPGLYLEHIDLSGNGKHNKLMQNAWFRQAIIKAINRDQLTKTFFGDIAPKLKTQQSLIFYQSNAAYTSHFKKWTYNPTAAKRLLTSHGCSPGGDGIMVCGGIKASITHWTTGTNKRRVLAAQVYKDELKSIGIDLELHLVPPNVMFSTSGLYSGNFDMAEYAWVTSPDPSFTVPWLKCKGGSNYMTFCDKKVTSLLNLTDKTLSPAKRSAYFNQADAIMANSVPVIPLYAQPSFLVYKSAVKGMLNNPSVLGPSWNAQAWRFAS